MQTTYWIYTDNEREWEDIAIQWNDSETETIPCQQQQQQLQQQKQQQQNSV